MKKYRAIQHHNQEEMQRNEIDVQKNLERHTRIYKIEIEGQ